MKIEVVFRLPDEEKMMKRLLEMGANQYLRTQFFPLLTRHAGEEVTVLGVIELLKAAIEEFVQKTIPDEMADSIKRLMYVSAEWFARALIDDGAVVAEIKKHFLHIIDTR